MWQLIGNVPRSLDRTTEEILTPHYSRSGTSICKRAFSANCASRATIEPLREHGPLPEGEKLAVKNGLQFYGCTEQIKEAHDHRREHD
jgi:hypothetical protein